MICLLIKERVLYFKQCMTECNFKKMGTFSDEGELVKEKIAEVNAEVNIQLQTEIYQS